MRQYRIASWILLIHSIINFTLAAPVAVAGTHGVRVNVVDVAKYRMAVLQERMDENPDEGQWSSDLTSEHAAPGPGSEPDSDSEMGSESESEPDSDDSDGGEAAQQWEEEFQNYEPSDGEEDDDQGGDDNHEEDDNHEQDDSEEDDHDQDSPHSPESQYPGASTYEDLWSKLLKGSLRPRASTLGAVDASKRKLQETDDTRAYVSTSILLRVPNTLILLSSMVRDVSEFLNAPVASASSVTGRGGATLQYSPGHSKNVA
jgi:hypothetical protein